MREISEKAATEKGPSRVVEPVDNSCFGGICDPLYYLICDRHMTDEETSDMAVNGDTFGGAPQPKATRRCGWLGHARLSLNVWPWLVCRRCGRVL